MSYVCASKQNKSWPFDDPESKWNSTVSIYVPKLFSIQTEVAHPHCLLRVLATCQVVLDILCKKSCVPCGDLKVRRISEAI